MSSISWQKKALLHYLSTLSLPLPLLMARKVTELLKTFCESKRLTTDKVAVHGHSLSLCPQPSVEPPLV